MKHVKLYEDDSYVDDDFGEEDEDERDERFMRSPEYFVETYYNGQFSQLRELLLDFGADDRMEELLDYIDEYMDSSDANDLKNWMLKSCY